MSMLEDDVRRTLSGRLDDLDIPSGPLEVVRYQARRATRRRRTWAVASTAALVATVAVGTRLVGGGGGHSSTPLPPSGAVSSWTRVGDVPLSHRDPGVVTEVAGKLLVYGGTPPHYCENVMWSCPAPRPMGGGAVFDPATGTWSPMSNAPHRLASWGGLGLTAVDGTRLVLLTNHLPIRVVTYDVGTDRWRGYPAPPVALMGNDMVAAGGGYAYVASEDDTASYPQRGRIERLDLRTGSWTLLPASPHRPRLSLRSMTVTPRGLLVAGSYGLDPNDLHYRSEVERYAGGRWLRYPSPVGMRSGGYSFAWTGRRLVSAFAGGTGGGALDVATGRWTRFARQPDPGSVGWQMGELPLGLPGHVVSGGLVFDLASGRTRVIAQPAGADSEAAGAVVGRYLYAVDARSVLWRTAL